MKYPPFKPDFPTATIYWKDHHFEMVEGRLWRRVTCGFIVEETDEHVVIASTVDEDQNHCEKNTIAKALIYKPKRYML